LTTNIPMHEVHMSEKQRAQAILYGVALGDALGWPIEFLPMPKINVIYGEAGIQEPPQNAQVTDETQTTLAIAEALIEAGSADLDTLMGAVTRKLIDWSNSPENNRAPGHTVTEAIRTLEAGVSWREAGVATAMGNGSVVRMSPVGFLYQNAPERLKEVAHAAGTATHAHRAADAGAIAAAYLIKLALDGVHPEEFVKEVMEFVSGISDEFDETLLKIGHVSAWTDEFAAINHLGSGWTAPDAVAMAIYCTMRYPDDFAGGLRRAVNIPGDSDSVGSVVGGILGARLGLDGIPTDWVSRLEGLDRITNIANQLAERKQKITQTTK
jgi:ADP-ribosylglycohydrolase